MSNIDWTKYFIGLDYEKEKLFIGVGKLKNNGMIKFLKKSDDRTVEIINAVGRFLKMKLNKSKKNYFGYDLNRIGKLVLIKHGYDFEVFKKRKNTITRPIQDF